MKKIFFLLCVLCGFVVNSNAQTITDTREYGSWIFSLKNDNSDNHFQPKNKFPPAFWITSFKISPAIIKKREALVNVFKETYPKPYKESVIFGFESLTKLLSNQVYGYNLHIGDYGFQYDNQGKIKPINYVSQFGNAYSGYASIYVNAIPENYLPENLSLKQESYDGKEYTVIDNLEIIPPQNNYEKDAKSWGIANPPSPLFNNAADKYNSFRYIRFTGSYPNILEEHKEMVLLTADGQLPYTNLSRGQFLEFLALKNQLARKALQLNFERTIKNEPKSVDYYTKINNDNIATIDWNLKVIEALKEKNKNDLNSPAIIHPDHLKMISSNTDYYNYYSTNKGVKGLRKDMLNNVFITDAKKGYSVCRFNKNYFNGLKADDIKSIIVQWEHSYRPASNPESGKLGLGKMQNYSDNPNTFFNAFMKKMDWDKLASLLTK
jgi:sulfur relay (sulfurtransferase) DsrC/TusE family protein